MKAEEFSSLSKEEQQKEVDKCSSFEYFYNNYCKKDDMPDFSQKAWEDYIEQIKNVYLYKRKDKQEILKSLKRIIASWSVIPSAWPNPVKKNRGRGLT